MKEYNHHYVYKVTDEVTGEYYIGKRSCNCSPEEDNYFGSGIWIKEHGTKGLVREVVECKATRKELTKAELQLISKHRNDELCRNRTVGKWDFTVYGQKMYVPEWNKQDAETMAFIAQFRESLEEVQRFKEQQHG